MSDIAEARKALGIQAPVDGAIWRDLGRYLLDSSRRTPRQWGFFETVFLETAFYVLGGLLILVLLKGCEFVERAWR